MQYLFVFSARVTPFKLSFVTDADEVTPAAAGTTANNELQINAAVGRTGTSGFSLTFTQVRCA